MLTCMSRCVMKPLFPMSHIWKNSQLFSCTELCPVPPLPHSPTVSLLPLLCHEVRPTALLMLSTVAQGVVEAAVVLGICCFESVMPRPSHEPGMDRAGQGGKRSWSASGCPTSETLNDVSDCHFLATTVEET